MLSRVEFQPQCVRKPPIAGCESTSAWFTHCNCTNPTSDAGAVKLSSSPDSFGRTTRRNGRLLDSRPKAKSCICRTDKLATLPKFTYRTESAGCLSNHRRYVASGSMKLPVLPFSWLCNNFKYASCTKGPTGNTLRRLRLCKHEHTQPLQFRVVQWDHTLATCKIVNKTSSDDVNLSTR